jgi:hypothetical protein
MMPIPPAIKKLITMVSGRKSTSGFSSNIDSVVGNLQITPAPTLSPYISSISQILPPYSTPSTQSLNVYGGYPFQSFISENISCFPEGSKGVWQMIDFTGDGRADLAFVKTDSDTGKIEVYVASAESNYQTVIVAATTLFNIDNDGTWLLAQAKWGGPPDLVYIKTQNTETKRVEIYIACGTSQYQRLVKEIATAFAEENDGCWFLANFNGYDFVDLVYIKTRDTGSNTTEVHVASGASNYRDFTLHTGTTFNIEPEGHGVWSLGPCSKSQTPDLVYIKTKNTGTNSVEVHIAPGADNYQFCNLNVGTPLPEADSGNWQLANCVGDGALELVWIKTRNTRTNHVEVHIAR